MLGRMVMHNTDSEQSSDMELPTTSWPVGKRWKAAKARDPLPVAHCGYCHVVTTAYLLDTKRVRIPVCKKCKSQVARPIPHDPEFEPGWRTPQVGTGKPHKYRGKMNVADMAGRLGISRQAMYKRIHKAESLNDAAGVQPAVCPARDRPTRPNLPCPAAVYTCNMVYR
jgi:hypothetical protein